MNVIEQINEWHRRARPEPTEQNFNVQLGCHLEEVVEMLDALEARDTGADGLWAAARGHLHRLAEHLKEGKVALVVTDRADFLDSLADQVVTAVGVGHTAKMNVPAACERVNNSNWTKYVGGKPLFNENGKIIKGPHYEPVDLTGLY